MLYLFLIHYRLLGTSAGTAGTATNAGFAPANPIAFNTGPGYLTLSGAQPIGLSGTFTGAGSLAVNMSTATTSVAIAGAGVGTGWTGLSNFINGQVTISRTTGDTYNNNATNAYGPTGGVAGAGNLVIIGSGQAGTGASIVQDANDFVNSTLVVVNGTGSFSPSSQDAMGGLILNGGSANLITLTNLEQNIAVLPNTTPVTVGGTGFSVARTNTSTAINVFAGALDDAFGNA